jgi:hypothetical protein
MRGETGERWRKLCEQAAVGGARSKKADGIDPP